MNGDERMNGSPPRHPVDIASTVDGLERSRSRGSRRSEGSGEEGEEDHQNHNQHQEGVADGELKQDAEVSVRMDVDS